MVRYDVPGQQLWHERFIAAVSRQLGWAYIVSPDGDHYWEWISRANPDLRDVRVIGMDRNTLPGDIPRPRIYRRPANPGAVQIANWLAMGQTELDLFDAILPPIVPAAPGPPVAGAGAAAPPGGAPPVAPAPAAAGGPGSWRVVVATGIQTFWDEVPAAAVTIVGDKGIATIAGETIFVQWIGQGVVAQA